MTHNHISNQTMTELTIQPDSSHEKGENLFGNGASTSGKEAQRFAVTIDVVVIDYM